MKKSNIRVIAVGQKRIRPEIVQSRSYLDQDPELPLYHFEDVPRGHRLKTVIRSARAYVQCAKALGFSCRAIHQMLQGHAPSPLDPGCEYELVLRIAEQLLENSADEGAKSERGR